MIAHLHPLHTDIKGPERFTYPFCYEPHPLCQLAARQVQAYIGSHPEIKEDADRGKMFGVLVVKPAPPASPSQQGQPEGVFFLAAYSGLLAGRNDWDFFVPPVYDAQQPDGYFKTTEREISQTLVAIWQEYYSRPKLLRKYPLPPGGTGDCCAPKLLQYAYQQGLKPVCMAEFWWGATTRTELRHHLNYYPACRGKCKPILTWMLQGLDVDPDPETLGFQRMELKTVYEDEWLLVVDKPSGMLSTPGRIDDYSVETIMQQRYPGSMIAHRLDMGTSGLLIIAKSLEVYRPLQEQFVKHQVRKKYLAMLEGRGKKEEIRGTISLPLRPDPMNRPRQVVDMEHGKRAVTDYEFLSDNLVALYPQTGRTHQLRIHCAHPDGLGRPIVGDELYGTKGERLMLHAAEIWFRHPVTGKEMHLVSDFPPTNETSKN